MACLRLRVKTRQKAQVYERTRAREQGLGSARRGSRGRAGGPERHGVCAREEAADEEHDGRDQTELNQNRLEGPAGWGVVMMRSERVGP